jgi:DNA-binding transcriptional MerR regulator
MLEVIAVKKLSEVCKIMGVTRRTLQEYDKMGLIKPSSKTEAGYWLYDDASIQKLILIQIFVEGGYERKNIKELLASPSLDLISEFDHLIEALEKKRQRIDGMINTLKNLRLTANLPESTLRAISKLDVTRVYKDKSFASYLNESIERAASYSEEDIQDAERYTPLFYNIIAIGCDMQVPFETDGVQRAVLEVYKTLNRLYAEDSSLSDKEIDVYEFASQMEEILTDADTVKMVETQCGTGSAKYIMDAIRLFTESRAPHTADQKEEG